MRAWVDRPREEAYLLNPSFCGALLAVAVAEYGSMPLPLTFIILPVVLHKRTRDQLPRDTRTSFVTWIQDNAGTRVQFAERAIALTDHTRQALIHAQNHGWIKIDENGAVTNADDPRLFNRGDRLLTDEAQECLRRARMVGRWYSRAGSASTVMALWGVRP